MKNIFFLFFFFFIKYIFDAPAVKNTEKKQNRILLLNTTQFKKITKFNFPYKNILMHYKCLVFKYTLKAENVLFSINNKIKFLNNITISYGRILIYQTLI